MEIFYSNYSVAFLTALQVMHLMMLADHMNDKDPTLFHRLEAQETFQFPETNRGHDGYLQGRIKTLALNDIYDIDFDVLSYADMLYWLEKYNIHLLMTENGKETRE